MSKKGHAYAKHFPNTGRGIFIVLFWHLRALSPTWCEIQVTLLLKELTPCFSEVKVPPIKQRKIPTPDQGLSVWAGSPAHEVNGCTF